MLEACLCLATTLNSLADGRITAAEAEQRIRVDDRPHHVADPEGLLGLDPLHASPLRLALGRLEHSLPSAPVWALLLPRPGRMAGLRGPAEVNRAALEAGAAVMTHDGALAWLGQQVGHGVQWRLARANRPMPPLDPGEAGRNFPRAVAEAAQALDGLDLVGGERPDQPHAPVLGPAYPPSSQGLLERAWTVLSAAGAGLAGQHEVLHSHAVLVREQHLRELAGAALDVVGATASWPTRALDG